MNSVDEDAYRHFKETLHADLTQNIKPVIISLTMLAEDYQKSSSVIVQSIEEYIKQVPSDLKLLGLYLMDSIMKNLKGSTNYIQLFERNIIQVFGQVFECVDEQNRKAMYKLRQTWNEVFPVRTLYDIDVRVKKIDPAWPITANPSGQSGSNNNVSKNTSVAVSASKSAGNVVNNAVSQQSNTSVTAVSSFMSTSSSTKSISSSTSVNNQEPKESSSLNINGNIQPHLQKHLKQPSKANNDMLEKNPIQPAKAQIGGASASLTARDPRLQRKPKPNVTTNSEAESNHNFPNQNAPPLLTPAFLSSPVKKATQLLKPQQNVDFQASQIHAGIKRTSPNSAQSPNPTEVKKLKYTNANSLNKPGNNEDKIENNNESIKPKPKKILLPPPSMPPAHLQQHPQQNMVQEQVKSTSSNKSTTLQTTVTSKSILNKANDNNESALNKSPKQKQTSPQQIQSRAKIISPKSRAEAESSNLVAEYADTDHREKMQISSSSDSSNDTENTLNSSKLTNPMQNKVNINNNSNNINNGKKIPSLFDNSVSQQSSSSSFPKKVSSQPSNTSDSNHNNNQNINTTNTNSSGIKSKPKATLNKTQPQQQQQQSIAADTNIKQVKASNLTDAKKLSINVNTTNSSNKSTTPKKTFPNNNSNSQNNVSKQSQQQQQQSQQSKIPKSNSSNSKFLENEDENNQNFENDVDERFISHNKATEKFDHFNKQINSINNLISSKSPPQSVLAAHSKSTTSIEHFINATNNTSSSSLSNENIPSKQDTRVLNTLKTNSDSLNELEERLKKSNESLKNPTSSSSTSTEELLEMIKTLVKQQQLLLDQQNMRNQEQQQKQAPVSPQPLPLPPPPPPAPPAQQTTPVSPTLPPKTLSPKQAQTSNLNENKSNQNLEDIGSSSTSFMESNYLDDQQDQEINESININEVVTYSQLPPIRPKDKNENQTDSLLIIDGRSFRIQPDLRRVIKIYYHDHELFCDTRTKDVYVDTKRVYKMGDTTKEIMLNGRRVRLMYMGKRIELWIDGMSFHFRADSPPKQIALTSSQSTQLKRFYVTIDSRTMDMYFNNYKVCKIAGGPHGNGPNIINARLSPDDFETHEISFVCPPKRIMIDGVPRKMRYDLAVPCIEMDNGHFHVIRFSGPPKDIFIDDQPFKCSFDKTIRIKLKESNRAHELAWGGPGYEVIIDGRPIELQFNKPPREVIIGTRPHFIYIGGEAPDVKIYGRIPNEFLQESENSKSVNQAPAPPPPTQSQPLAPPPLMSQQIDISKLKNQTNFNLISASNNQPQNSMQPAKNGSSAQPDIHQLFKKLLEANILPPPAVKTDVKDEEKLPDLTSLDTELLKKKYNGAILSLYSGIQCAACGNRFNQHDSGTASSRYSKHLDWHFRQNKREKEEINKAHSREWYYSLADWILYEELSEESLSQQESDQMSNNHLQSSNGESNKEHANNSDNHDTTNNPNLSSIFDQSSRDLRTFNSSGTKTCPATDDIGDSCCICEDPFEIFWFEEREEWHFRDAIRVENRIYHPICFEDAREDSVPPTPLQRTMSQISINQTPSNSTTEISATNNSSNSNMGLNKNLFFIKNEPMESSTTSKSHEITLNSSLSDANTSSQTLAGVVTGFTETTNISFNISLDNTANDQDDDDEDDLMNVDQVTAVNTNEILNKLVENSFN